MGAKKTITPAGRRQKGKRGEREVAAFLGTWWGYVEPGCVFKSTPGSGAWASKGAVRGAFKTSGDLVTTAKLFPFTVEVKFREGFQLHTLLVGRKSPVWGWWNQACAQAAETTPPSIPMLWFRKANDGWLVLVPKRCGLSTRVQAEPSAWFLELGPPSCPGIESERTIVTTWDTIAAIVKAKDIL